MTNIAKRLRVLHVYDESLADIGTEAADRIEALEAALDEYACLGLGKCSEPTLNDGSCVHAVTGRCGDIARRALNGCA